MKAIYITALALLTSCSAIGLHSPPQDEYAGHGIRNGEVWESVTAYADLDGRSLEVRVYNDSGQPLTTSYFLDKWAARDSADRVFVIEKPPIHVYQRKGAINPGESAVYYFRLPAGVRRPPLIVGQIGSTVLTLWKK